MSATRISSKSCFIADADSSTKINILIGCDRLASQDMVRISQQAACGKIPADIKMPLRVSARKKRNRRLIGRMQIKQDVRLRQKWSQQAGARVFWRAIWRL